MPLFGHYDTPYQTTWGHFEAGQPVWRDGRPAIVLAAPEGQVPNDLVPIMLEDGSREMLRVSEVDLWEELNDPEANAD